MFLFFSGTIRPKPDIFDLVCLSCFSSLVGDVGMQPVPKTTRNPHKVWGLVLQRPTARDC